MAQSTAGSALCNNRPFAVDDGYQILQDEVLGVAEPGVLGNDSDLNGDGVTAVLNTPPANGTATLNLNGSFVYTPTAGFFGTDTFTYRAMDVYDESRLATVTITVTEVNTPPLALPDAYTTTKNVALSVAAPGVLDNDTDDDGDSLTAVLDTPPANGNLTLLASGAFIYTPTTNYTGTDSFTYRANDGSDDSNIATVSLTILEGNAPPVAINDQYTTTEDMPLVVTQPGLLANDSDPNGDILTAVLNTPPSSGSLTVNLDGSFIYTPTLGFMGDVTFTYHASDGQAQSNAALVTVQVQPLLHHTYLPFVAREP